MEFITRKELCRRYRVSEPTLDKWIRMSLIPAPCMRCGRVLRWKLADIEKAEAVKSRKNTKQPRRGNDGDPCVN